MGIKAELQESLRKQHVYPCSGYCFWVSALTIVLASSFEKPAKHSFATGKDQKVRVQ